MVKLGVLIVPMFMTAGIALYRVDQAEAQIAQVAETVQAAREERAEDMASIAVTQKEVSEALTEIKISVGVLCQATNNVRCP